ncbi:MAG: DUF4339 domain-containing protein [bacterium]
MRYYTLNSNNEPQGPFSMEEIRASMKSDTLSLASLVCREGEKEWIPLSSVIQENSQKPTNANKTNRHANLLYGGCGIALGVLVTLAGLFILNNTGHSSSEPAYIAKVLGKSGGVDGIRIILLFKDAKDKGTSATGKVVVEVYEQDQYNAALTRPFAVQEFTISQADFKNADYGLWNDYMITLPRLVYPPGYVAKSKYGTVKVYFTSPNGTKLVGEGSAISLKG